MIINLDCAKEIIVTSKILIYKLYRILTQRNWKPNLVLFGNPTSTAKRRLKQGFGMREKVKLIV
jgi:hypothetical protein